MYNWVISEHLKDVMNKLSKKDISLYGQLLKKIEEIINSDSIEKYKNLKHNLKNYKRVHIGHFVLIFQYDSISNTIHFDDFDHHDKVY